MIPKNLKKTVMAGMVAAFCAAPAVSHAYHACQCVGYIKNRPEFRTKDKNLAYLPHIQVGTAAKMGRAYFDRWNSGYRKVDLSRELPRNKDVIIFHAGSRVGGITFHRTAGHVGMVGTALARANHLGGGMYLDLVSANVHNNAGNSVYGQYIDKKRPDEFSEYGCDNVSTKHLTILPKEYRYIEVYRKE